MKNLILILSILLSASPLLAQDLHVYPHEEGLIELLFIQESQVRLVDGLPIDHSGLNAHEGVLDVLMQYGGGEFERFVDLPEPLLDDWAAEASLTHGEPVYNLNNIYRVRLVAPVDEAQVAFQFETLPGVSLAYPVALPPELPVPGSFVSQQNYLDPASSTPTGVDALWSWTQTGGTGAGVTVCDLEYSWNRNHNDVTQLAFAELNTNIADPFANFAHGTQVAGVLSSNANGWGTTGVCHGATLKTCGTYYGLPLPSWNPAGAIAIAAAALQAGDVLLLEQQWDYNGAGGFVPVEWYPQTTGMAQGVNAVYAAIRNATGVGIHVVEAGGNGNMDTDLMTWQGDSGAIIVGAGGAYTGGSWPAGDLQRLGYSSYGSRFDLQGWGENVVTTGVGDLHSVEGVNLYYTSAFNGTSSASPIVAGAVANLVSWYAQNVSATPMSTAAVRSALVSTGTPQAAGVSGHIGPRPDLLAAIQSLTPPPRWTDVTSGPLGNAGWGRSVAWDDYDLDGDDDLYITNTQSQNHLLRNEGGGVFTDQTLPPLDNLMFSGAAEFGDSDDDGFPDIYLGNLGNPNRLFMNLGGFYTEMTGPPVDDFADGWAVTWVDADRDGRLDLHVGTVTGAPNRCFLGLGLPGLFMDATMPPLDDPVDCRDAAWGDVDGDGAPDVYVSRWGQPNELLLNDGAGGFLLQPMNVWSDGGNGTGACWGDCDDDGDLDLYITNSGTGNRLLRNDWPLGFTDVTGGPLAINAVSHGAAWADYDNDGDLDLYVAVYGGANKLLRNDGAFTFTDDTNGPLGDAAGGEGVAWADHDNDGDLDLYLVNHGSANRLFRNDVNSGNNWLQVSLHGIVSNAQAIGARVRVVAGGRSMIREIGAGDGYCGQSSKRLHFGLGQATYVDSLIVTWPSGTVQDTLGLQPNQQVHIHEWYAVGVDNPRPVFGLEGAAPNPFNPATEIAFSLERDGHVELKLYDLRGQLVDVLCDGHRDAGRHVLPWRPDGLASGTYFYVLRAGGREDVGRCQLVK